MNQPGCHPRPGEDTPDGARVVDGASDHGRPKRPGHVLVAEDNEVNQLVAVGLLESLGYTTDVAVNGEEAVTKAVSGAFDVVLLDVQTPRPDGYAASRRIRALEAPERRVPIIAMTASAVEGVRERCREAGMDDFLTKPVVTDRLDAVLRSQIAGDGRSGLPRVPPPTRTGVTLDPARIEELLQMGGRATELVERAVGNFVTRMPVVVAELRAAMANRAGDDVGPLAHRLKGSALNLGAHRVAEISFDLEQLEAHEIRDRAPLLLAELEDAAAETAAALDGYRAGKASG